MIPTTQMTEISYRETEVLKLLSEGMTNEQIGESFFIAVRTVHNHINSIYDKMGLRDGGNCNARVVAAKAYWERAIMCPINQVKP